MTIKYQIDKHSKINCLSQFVYNRAKTVVVLRCKRSMPPRNLSHFAFVIFVS